MRIFAATTAGSGHFLPMVPVLAAARDRGHEVVVCCPESFVGSVEGAGFLAAPFADVSDQARGALIAKVTSLPPEQIEQHYASTMFGRLAPQAALPGLSATVAARRPAVIVHESGESASVLVAEHEQIPTVHVAIGPFAHLAHYLPLIRTGLKETRVEAGLPPDDRDDAAAVAAGLDQPSVSGLPLSLEDPTQPGPEHAVRFTPEPDIGPGMPTDWQPREGLPVVYVSLGTEAAKPEIGLWPWALRTILVSLADAPVQVFATTGIGDPADLGPLPPDTYVTRFVAQDAVFEHADAVVCHGGAGTTYGSLRAGLPIAVIPLFADQPLNAATVARSGGGIVVDKAELNTVADAVVKLLDDDAYHAAAQRIHADAMALPGPGAAVDLIEQVGA